MGKALCAAMALTLLVFAAPVAAADIPDLLGGDYVDSLGDCPPNAHEDCCHLGTMSPSELLWCTLFGECPPADLEALCHVDDELAAAFVAITTPKSSFLP